MPARKKSSVKRKVSFKKVSKRRKASSVKRKPVARRAVKKVSSRRKAVVVRKAVVPKPAHWKKSYGYQLGNELGSLVGFGKLGGLVGAGLQKITGHGEYHIQENSILHGSQIPQFAGRNSIRVRHREYIGDINSATAFTNTSYSINPGLPGTFPWLSNVASNYEEYKFHGLVFEFRSTSANSVGSTNISLGTVIAGTEYNATLPAYISKLQMENAEFSSSCNVCDSMLHPVECKKSETVLGELYVRSNLQTTTQDVRLYDLGNFQLAVTGCQAGGNVVGELWASYDVELFKAKIAPSAGSNVASVHYNSLTSVSTTNYWGTAQNLKGSSPLNLTFTGTTMTFPTNTWPIGTYLVSYNIWCASATVTAPTVTATSNCNLLNFLNGDTVSQYNTPAGSTTQTNVNLTFYIQVTGPGAVLTFSGGTFGGSTTMDLVVSPINYFDTV